MGKVAPGPRRALMKPAVNRTVINLAGAFVGAGLIIILAFVTWALVFLDIPDQNQNNLTLLIGNLVALVGLVVGFFFGSSSENRKQTETIDTLATTAATAQAALTPVAAADVVLKPGETATVATTEETKP